VVGLRQWLEDRLLPILLPYPPAISGKWATSGREGVRDGHSLRLKLQLLTAENACRGELSSRRHRCAIRWGHHSCCKRSLRNPWIGRGRCPPCRRTPATSAKRSTTGAFAGPSGRSLSFVPHSATARMRHSWVFARQESGVRFPCGPQPRARNLRDKASDFLSEVRELSSQALEARRASS